MVHAGVTGLWPLGSGQKARVIATGSSREVVRARHQVGEAISALFIRLLLTPRLPMFAPLAQGLGRQSNRHMLNWLARGICDAARDRTLRSKLQHHRVRSADGHKPVVGPTSQLLRAEVARLLRAEGDHPRRQSLKREMPFAGSEIRALRTALYPRKRMANGLAGDGVDDRSAQRKGGVALARS